MLQSLHIQNYAIIDEIDIQFSPKLNIITGETGAGKSILMGALSLILGERADTSVLKLNDKKCFIEGVFQVKQKKAVQQFLAIYELDNETELVVRREIAANGKSRAFINDTPATVQQLKELASLLVDLHQQFDTLELIDTVFQREVLDALANNEEALQTYQSIYRRYNQEKKELDILQQQKAAFTKEFDYNQFLFDELNEVGLTNNELEDLDQELQLLNNAEEIKNTLNKTWFELKESEQPILPLLKQMTNQLQLFNNYHPELPTLIQRLQSSLIELEDIATETGKINDTITYEPLRIEWINDRLNTGYKLLKKHGLHTTADLLHLQAELQQKLQAVLNADEAIQQKEKETNLLLQQANEKAALISTQRSHQITPLEEKVNALLVQVGMPNARLKVQVTTTALNLYGADMIAFLFDANKSNRFEPIGKVASGGELSRLMLCIKSLVAESIDLPTMIFDEIDTGISGEAAKQVGLIMKQLASKRQVIAITHQPQIAGKADAHYFVYKDINQDGIKTNIKLLSQEERITTIAQMLSGEQPTAAALENAREMLLQ